MKKILANRNNGHQFLAKREQSRDKTELPKMHPNELTCLYVAAVGMSGSPYVEVYARVMNDGVSLETHRLVVAEFIRQDIMREQFQYLTLTRKGQAILLRITDAVLVA